MIEYDRDVSSEGVARTTFLFGLQMVVLGAAVYVILVGQMGFGLPRPTSHLAVDALIVGLLNAFVHILIVSVAAIACSNYIAWRYSHWRGFEEYRIKGSGDDGE